jgi:hypothetical protein
MTRDEVTQMARTLACKKSWPWAEPLETFQKDPKPYMDRCAKIESFRALSTQEKNQTDRKGFGLPRRIKE